MSHDIFPSASELRSRKKKSTTVHTEITQIQSAILEADEAGFIDAIIKNTLMSTPGSTDSEEYYLAWKNIGSDRLRELEMSEVITFFQARGYSINRETNPLSLDTFIWDLKW